MEHDAEGLFLDAAVTRWKRGETAPVIFASHAHHWGKQHFKKYNLSYYLKIIPL